MLEQGDLVGSGSSHIIEIEQYLGIEQSRQKWLGAPGRNTCQARFWPFSKSHKKLFSNFEMRFSYVKISIVRIE